MSMMAVKLTGEKKTECVLTCKRLPRIIPSPDISLATLELTVNSEPNFYKTRFLFIQYTGHMIYFCFLTESCFLIFLYQVLHFFLAMSNVEAICFTKMDKDAKDDIFSPLMTA